MFSLIELGNRVKRRREHLNLTQKELAQKSGVVQSTIGRIERADLNASIENISRLATALEVSIDYLCDNESVTPENNLITINSSLNLSKKDYEFIISIVEHMVKLLGD